MLILPDMSDGPSESLALCVLTCHIKTVFYINWSLFLFQREAILIKELSRETAPNKIFTFSTRIWLPSNYIITKTTKGQSEVIPTVVKATLIPENLKKIQVPVFLFIYQIGLVINIVTVSDIQ